MHFFILLLLSGLARGYLFTDIDETAPTVLGQARDAGEYSGDACEIVNRKMKDGDWKPDAARNVSGTGCQARTAPCLVSGVLTVAIELANGVYENFFEGTGFGFFGGHWKNEMQAMRGQYDEMLSDLSNWTDLQERQVFGDEIANVPMAAIEKDVEYVDTEKGCVQLMQGLMPVLDRGLFLLNGAVAFSHRFGQVRPLDRAADAAAAASAVSQFHPPPRAHPTLPWVPRGVAALIQDDSIDETVLNSMLQVISVVKNLRECVRNPVKVSCSDAFLQETLDEMEAQFTELGDRYMPIFCEFHADAIAPPVPQTSRTQLGKQQLLDLTHAAHAAAKQWQECVERTMCNPLEDEHLRGQVAGLFVSIVQYSIEQNVSSQQQVEHEEKISFSAAAEILMYLEQEADMKSKARANFDEEEMHRQQQWITRRLATAAVAAAVMLPALCRAWRGLSHYRWSSVQRRDGLHDLLLPMDESTLPRKSQSGCPSMLFALKPTDFVAILASLCLWGLVSQLLWLYVSSHAEAGESSPYYSYWSSFAEMAYFCVRDITHVSVRDGANLTQSFNHIVPELLERIVMMTPA